MATTTIRIDDALKARVTAAARRAGKTAHAFILDAIAGTVERAELHDRFHAEANDRWLRILDRGETVPWDDLRAWLSSHATGQPPVRRPRARKL